MLKYLLKRLLMGLVTLFALATVTFFLMHIIPGSPFAGELSRVPGNVKEKLIASYGLDKPLIVQFGLYLKNACTGDFGTSIYHKGKDVVDLIADGMGPTASVGLVGFAISMFVGIAIGTAAAFSRKRWVGVTAAFIATIGISVPSFLLAVLMKLAFGVKLGWLPTMGLATWKGYIMPGFALAFGPIAMISRLVRTSLTEVMRQDYMVLAASKGTGGLTLICRHALKNAIIPVITYAGPLIATLLTGSFVIETMFVIPGIGAEFVKSVSNRDYTLIMALTIFYGAFIIVANIVTDILTAAVDPRIRLK